MEQEIVKIMKGGTIGEDEHIELKEIDDDLDAELEKELELAISPAQTPGTAVHLFSTPGVATPASDVSQV